MIEQLIEEQKNFDALPVEIQWEIFKKIPSLEDKFNFIKINKSTAKLFSGYAKTVNQLLEFSSGSKCLEPFIINFEQQFFDCKLFIHALKEKIGFLEKAKEIQLKLVKKDEIEDDDLVSHLENEQLILMKLMGLDYSENGFLWDDYETDRALTIDSPIVNKYVSERLEQIKVALPDPIFLLSLALAETYRDENFVAVLIYKALSLIEFNNIQLIASWMHVAGEYRAFEKFAFLLSELDEIVCQQILRVLKQWVFEMLDKKLDFEIKDYAALIEVMHGHFYEKQKIIKILVNKMDVQTALNTAVVIFKEEDEKESPDFVTIGKRLSYLSGTQILFLVEEEALIVLTNSRMFNDNYFIEMVKAKRLRELRTVKDMIGTQNISISLFMDEKNILSFTQQVKYLPEISVEQSTQLSKELLLHLDLIKNEVKDWDLLAILEFSKALPSFKKIPDKKLYRKIYYSLTGVKSQPLQVFYKEFDPSSNYHRQVLDKITETNEVECNLGKLLNIFGGFQAIVEFGEFKLSLPSEGQIRWINVFQVRNTWPRMIQNEFFQLENFRPIEFLKAIQTTQQHWLLYLDPKNANMSLQELLPNTLLSDAHSKEITILKFLLEYPPVVVEDVQVNTLEDLEEIVKKRLASNSEIIAQVGISDQNTKCQTSFFNKSSDLKGKRSAENHDGTEENSAKLFKSDPRPPFPT